MKVNDGALFNRSEQKMKLFGEAKANAIKSGPALKAAPFSDDATNGWLYRRITADGDGSQAKIVTRETQRLTKLNLVCLTTPPSLGGRAWVKNIRFSVADSRITSTSVITATALTMHSFMHSAHQTKGGGHYNVLIDRITPNWRGRHRAPDTRTTATTIGNGHAQTRPGECGEALSEATLPPAEVQIRVLAERGRRD